VSGQAGREYDENDSSVSSVFRLSLLTPGAVNSVAVVVNLDFIVIRCLRRPVLDLLILQESLRFGMHYAELMSAGFTP
jgi:hypothetical protein